MFIIFDNGGITPDRFTIINKETGDVFGAGENPYAPNSVGKFIGNCADHLIALRGAGWRQKLPSRKIIKAEIDNYINNAKLDPDWIGKEVDLASLPEEVRRYISRIDAKSRTGEHSEGNIVYMSRGSGDVGSVS